MGVRRRHHEMQSEQNGEFIDEVNKPWGSTQIIEMG